MTGARRRYFVVACAGLGLYIFGMRGLLAETPPRTCVNEVPPEEWARRQVTMRKAAAREFAADLREQGLVIAEAPS